tara:strand:- start:702 stop:1409 length:708 start_codon:yes stop_codon:yes gene_type:complete
MARENKKLPTQTGSAEVSDFLEKLALAPTVKSSNGAGRLLFAMDATASREPTWDRACHTQGEMFKATDALGGLAVQLVFFRGFGECKNSSWLSSSDELVRRMTSVYCRGGRTQIGKVFAHAIRETKVRKINALVFVGDAMEEEVDDLCHSAGKLGVLGVPIFVFQEGSDIVATQAFKQFAALTGGAHCGFDGSSANQLKELLAAVAVFAAGGLNALKNYGKEAGPEVAQITSQVK